LWRNQAPGGPRGNLVSEEEASACWKRVGCLRGHTDDVIDVTWSSDGTSILTGSVDNKAFVWDVAGKRRGQVLAHLANHKHFVQGVAWDPAQQYVITQSADRTVKVFTLRPPPAARRNKVSQYFQPACDTAAELYCAHTLNRREIPALPDGDDALSNGKPSRHPLFLDEVSLPSFFRRPAWSPDGSFVVLPAGIYRQPRGTGDVYTAYLFARGRWNAPIAHLPAQTKPVVAVRFSPLLYRLPAGSSSSGELFHKLPFKMVFAVATVDSVVIYDTTSLLPLAVLGQLHYESITDLAWSRDGLYLAVSSMDCYCSIAAFGDGELGECLPRDEVPAHIAKRLPGLGMSYEATPSNELHGVDGTRTRAVGQDIAPSLTAPITITSAVAAGQARHAASGVRKKRIVPEAIIHVASVEGSTGVGVAAEGKKLGQPRPPHQPIPAGAYPSSIELRQTQQDLEKDRSSKRITPSPVASQALRQFEQPKQAAMPAQRPCDLPSNEAPAQRRRITPVPVVNDVPAFQGMEVSVQRQQATPGGVSVSVASLALAAGKAAALQAERAD
jgi:chromatin assembly factor 1 subunit B